MNKFSILFENDEILVVNKPYGTSVQGGAGVAHPLDEELSKQTGYKVYLVHRLDKETSGLLIVAKNPAAAARWTNLIGTREVKKEYLCICAGEVTVNGKKNSRGTLVSEVTAHGRKQKAELFYETAGETEVSVEKAVEDTTVTEKIKLSLIHITLGTGRMHQIRIQMAQNGAPLAADDQHGNFKVNKLLRKAGIKKLQLVCARLTIPEGQGKKVIVCELPEHFYKGIPVDKVLL